MSLRLYYIFKMVVECGTISDAAKKLYMSQPAVTHAIAQLEEKLSIILFERIGKRLYISDGGKQLYQKACQLITVYEDLTTHAKQLNQKPTLRIGSSITNANLLLPQLLQVFQKQYEGSVTVTVQNAQNIEEQLFHNEIDLAFLEGAVNKNELIQIPLCPYENLIFCSNNSKLSHTKCYDYHELAQEAWLLREKGSAIRDTFDSIMRLSDLVIQPVWESVNSQVLIEGVKAGLGISILPAQLIQQELKQQTIKLLSVTQTISCHNHIVYHKDKHLHEGMKQLLALCKQRKLMIEQE